MKSLKDKRRKRRKSHKRKAASNSVLKRILNEEELENQINEKKELLVTMQESINATKIAIKETDKSIKYLNRIITGYKKDLEKLVDINVISLTNKFIILAEISIKQLEESGQQRLIQLKQSEDYIKTINMDIIKLSRRLTLRARSPEI